MCVREREGESVCVCVRERDREGERPGRVKSRIELER